MPDSLDQTKIKSILQILGSHISIPSRLVLVGGSALALLGSQRLTIDIDFLGDDISPSPLDKAILQATKELKVLAEPVPLHRFIPLPSGSETRTIYIGKFENLEVYVADPYSIALSKIERGFDTDIDDILFLLQHGFIEIEEFDAIVESSLPRAREFDINTSEMLAHLHIVKSRLKK
jgi:hypothetical protein